MKIIFAAIGFFTALFYRPVVLVYGWDAFVVPLGVPAVHYWQMFGLSMLVAMLTHQESATDYSGDDAATKLIGIPFGLAAVHFIFWILVN